MRDYSCQCNGVALRKNALTGSGVRSASCEMVNGWALSIASYPLLLPTVKLRENTPSFMATLAVRSAVDRRTTAKGKCGLPMQHCYDLANSSRCERSSTLIAYTLWGWYRWSCCSWKTFRMELWLIPLSGQKMTPQQDRECHAPTMWSGQFFRVRSWALYCRLPVSRSETSQNGVWCDAADILVDAVLVKFGGPLCCLVG